MLALEPAELVSVCAFVDDDWDEPTLAGGNHLVRRPCSISKLLGHAGRMEACALEFQRDDLESVRPGSVNADKQVVAASTGCGGRRMIHVDQAKRLRHIGKVYAASLLLALLNEASRFNFDFDQAPSSRASLRHEVGDFRPVVVERLGHFVETRGERSACDVEWNLPDD